MVKQFSGEDWYQPSKFTLSTAEPGIGGTVPEIGIQKVQFKVSNEPVPESTMPAIMGSLTPLPSSNLRKSNSRFSSFRKSRTASMTGFDSGYTDTSPPVNIVNKELKNELATTPINETALINKPFNLASVTFDVTRPPMVIACDNIECRVMIAVINLDPHYQHVTVPRLSQYAYLRTVSTNTSKYTILAGPANIYIDSNFIGKTELKTTSPCEEFICNLGADRGIKVSYMPMLKYKENKGKTICVTYKQEIQVTNNHERPIRILVMDQIPLSADEKIKISLLEPTIKHPEKYDKSKMIRMSSNRLIEWDCDIGSKERKEMVLKFAVEHPYGKDIEVLQIK